MKAEHEAYEPLKRVVAAIKDVAYLDSGLREQLNRLHGALEEYGVPFHRQDMRAISMGLHVLGREAGGPSIYSHTNARAFDREEREAGRR